MIMAVAAAPTRRRPIPLTLSTIGKVAFSDDPEKQYDFFNKRIFWPHLESVAVVQQCLWEEKEI